MTEQQRTLQDVRAAIAELPKVDRDKVLQATGQLRWVVACHGDHGVMAMALIGAEIAAS